MSYKVEMINVNILKEYENNPRINKNSIEKVADSIRTYGWKVPIVVDEDMIILAGHTRLSAAKLLDIKEVPAHIAKGLTDEQKTEEIINLITSHQGTFSTEISSTMTNNLDRMVVHAETATAATTQVSSFAGDLVNTTSEIAEVINKLDTGTNISDEALESLREVLTTAIASNPVAEIVFQGNMSEIVEAVVSDDRIILRP